MDDLRKLLKCVPRLTWLDVGTSEYNPNKAVKAYNAVSTISERPFPDIKLLRWQLGRLGNATPTRPGCSDVLWRETVLPGEGTRSYRIRSQ